MDVCDSNNSLIKDMCRPFNTDSSYQSLNFFSHSGFMRYHLVVIAF